MGPYGLSDSEIENLRPFVTEMVNLGLLPDDLPGKIDQNHQLKADLSRIQKRVDAILCFPALNPMPGVDINLTRDYQILAARAHFALERRRKYDWKAD